MKERKSFLFYYDWENIYEPLDDIRKAKLIMATIRYAKDNTDTRFDDLTLKVLFNVIKDTIDRDAEKYDIKCKINSDNGKRGGRPKKQNKPNENEKTERLLTKAKKADIDIERDKDIVIDTEIEKENYSSFSSKTACEYSEDFLDFWKEYPKKVGKGEAFKQWKKAKLTKADKEDILSALKWQKRSDRWCDNKGRYIPNPSTYISQRRWEDEPYEDVAPDYTDPSRYTGGNTLPDFIARGEF